MKKTKPNPKLPKVTIARPAGRPFQLRYVCPLEKRQVRVSVGNRDENEALRLKSELEAKFILGISTRTSKESLLGPDMAWDDFREQYRILHLKTVRESTAIHAESRLDLTERILAPKKLSDVADPNALQQLQARLFAGEQSRRNMPRSAHTVKGYINSVLSVLNWAYLQGWLPVAPKLRKIKTGKQKAMKGRPITAEEFQRMLGATVTVVGAEAADSWKYILRGLWESALRLDEIMHLSWDKPGAIRPVWPNGKHPILEIPAAMQKNDTDESIPLHPWFETVLLETPEMNRTGWAFNPVSLQVKQGRQVTSQRPDAEWVGKVIGRIGKNAGIEVDPADERTGRPTKYATAHDLRRSCGERLREAGVPPLVICRVMRHSSWETTRKHYAPGNVQSDAEVLRSVLAPK